MSKGWDSGMLKKLKALVGKGLSTAEMGKKLGMSKNAVVGKLNRLGWNAKASEPVEKVSAKDKKTTKNPVANSKKVSVKKVKKPVDDVVARVAEKKSATKKSVAAPKKVVETATNKEQKIKLPEIKTASKKTKKDLALHELLIQHALQMANLKPNQCRWPIGDPDSDNFHFCGEQVFSGKPYCYEHCRQAYQFTAPKKK